MYFHSIIPILHLNLIFCVFYQILIHVYRYVQSTTVKMQVLSCAMMHDADDQSLDMFLLDNFLNVVDDVIYLDFDERSIFHVLHRFVLWISV